MRCFDRLKNFLPLIKKYIIEIIEGKIKGQIEVTRRRGRRRKKLLDDLRTGEDTVN